MSKIYKIVLSLAVALVLILPHFSIVSFASATEAPTPEPTVEATVTIEETVPDNISASDITKIEEGDIIVDEDGEITLEPKIVTNLEDGEHTIILNQPDGIYSTTVIVENGIPLTVAPFSILNAWSLFNLLSAMLIVCATFYVAFAPKQKFDHEISEEKLRSIKIVQINIICAMIIGSLLIVTLLFVTQDYTQPMTLFDDYSIIFGILTILAIFSVSESNNKLEKQCEDIENSENFEEI